MGDCTVGEIDHDLNALACRLRDNTSTPTITVGSRGGVEPGAKSSPDIQRSFESE